MLVLGLGMVLGLGLGLGIYIVRVRSLKRVRVRVEKLVWPRMVLYRVRGSTRVFLCALARGCGCRGNAIWLN